MLTNATAPTIDLITVPAGEFRMGKTINHPEARESPEHTVMLEEYQIGRYLVTNAQYQIFIDDTGHPRPNQYKPDEANHPVSGVTWADAWLFCAWMRYKTGKPYHLPTEAQWEKAATWNPKTNQRQEFPWGNDFDARLCNVAASGFKGTTPVGKFSPEGDSPYGCADMIGNLDEWCNSIMLPYPYEAWDAREERRGESISGVPRRVIRGGDWYTITQQSPFRRNAPSDWWQHLWGFRVAVSNALGVAHAELMRRVLDDMAEGYKLRDEAIKADPANPQHWYDRAAWYFNYQTFDILRFQECEADSNKAIELVQKHGKHKLTVDLAWLYFNRAGARSHLKKYKEALEDINEAIRLDSKDISAYLVRAEIAIHLQNWRQAEADFAKLTAAQTGNPRVRLLEGHLKAGSGNKQAAIAIYTELINQPLWTSLGMPSLYYWRGKLYEEQGNLEAAMSDYCHYLLWESDAEEAANLKQKLETYRNC